MNMRRFPSAELKELGRGTEPDFNFDKTNHLEIRTYTRGEWFGELSLLYQPIRGASVVTEEETVCWLLDRMTFKHACQSNWESNFETTTKTLKTVPLLKALTEDQLKDVAQVSRFEEYNPGDVIIKAGTKGDTFYLVQAGSVLVRVSTHEESTRSAGDFFGELSLLHDKPRAATIIALEDVTLLCIDKSTFINMLGPLRDVIDDNIRAFALQDIDIFRELTTDQRVKIFKLFEKVTFKKDDVIIREGEVGDMFYVLRTGSAEVTKVTSTGEILHLKVLNVGDYFGEMAMIYGKPRVATVKALEDCECFRLKQEEFTKLNINTKSLIVSGAEERQYDNFLKEQALQRKKREEEIKQLLAKVNNQAVVNEVVKQNTNFIPQTFDQRIQPTKQFQVPILPPRLKRTRHNLSEFKSLCTLGTGTFGRVKLVIHTETNRTFALKIQSKYQIMKYNLRSNIFNEKTVLMKINHPFVVTLHQTFQDGDYLYMLLELVQGGELFSLLQTYGPRLQTPHHVFYISCVISAFEALHLSNILYRDLKPENLMIDYLGYLKIVDFGFAKTVQRRTFTLCGTPEYFSPELVLGKGYGKGNDIWALGILAYELISGYTPFGNNDDPQTEIYRKIVRDDLFFPRDCYDQQGMHLIASLLNKNEGLRFGCTRLGITSIKSHPWFSQLNWNDLLFKRLTSPWIPKIKNQVDASNFDNYNERYKLFPFVCDPNSDPFLGF